MLQDKKNLKKERGITLIALVVTIIVLMILARNNSKYVIRRGRNS